MLHSNKIPYLKKNEIVKGKQFHKCGHFGIKFIGGHKINNLELWQAYVHENKTYLKLALKSQRLNICNLKLSIYLTKNLIESNTAR